MPQAFIQAVMTVYGEQLYAKALAGKCNPEYVCIAVGNGQYEESEREKEYLKRQTCLKSEKNRYIFSDGKTSPDNQVYLEAIITNYDQKTKTSLITEGYHINEIGIYAKESGQPDGEEKLVSICITANPTGNGDYMPEYNGTETTITQGYYINVADAENVIIDLMKNTEIVPFEVPIKREELKSGETLSILFGKVKRWLSDLKKIAFTGDYADLNNTPTNFAKSGTGAKAGLVPAPPTEAGTTKYLREDGNWIEPPDTKTSIANNQITTEEGFALDARQANPNIAGTLGAQIATLNSNLSAFKIFTCESIELLDNELNKYTNICYFAIIIGGTGLILGYKNYSKYQRQLRITYWDNKIYSRAKSNSTEWNEWVSIE